MDDQPLFDSTRTALIFALNAGDVKMPKPAMTSAMATGVKVRLKKRKRKPSEDDELAAALDKEAEYAALVRAAFRRKPEKFTPLERAAQAGFILAEFAKLQPQHQTILIGLLMRSHSPCACRRPCCSGSAINLRWAKAVEDACLMLRDEGSLIRNRKTRGLSTQPQLRREVVAAFFQGREVAVVDLARMAECSLVTAAKHRNWITTYLEREEDIAWVKAAELLDQAGITGAIF